MNKCVYCSLEQEEPFGDAHVIPRAFGKFLFNGQEIIQTNKVCDECNNEIGDCEGELAYAGYEAVMRRKIGVKGRRPNKSKESPFYPNRRAPKPIVIQAKTRNGEIEFFEIDRATGEFIPLNSISFVHPHTSNIEHVALVRGMTKENLVSQLKERGYPVGTGYKIIIRCDPANSEWIEELLGVDAKGIQWEDCDPETEEREAVIDIQVSERYFRAIAKIGFEYMLYFEPQGITGYEAAFDLIKNYIRHGVGKFDDFLKKHEQSIIPHVGPEYNIELTHYGHVLACEVNSQRVIARVELFTGKSAGVGQWVISLGKCPYSLYIPPLSIGHWFKIHSGIGDANDSGEVIELTATNMIFPVSAPPIQTPRVIPLKLK